MLWKRSYPMPEVINTFSLPKACGGFHPVLGYSRDWLSILITLKFENILKNLESRETKIHHRSSPTFIWIGFRRFMITIRIIVILRTDQLVQPRAIFITRLSITAKYSWPSPNRKGKPSDAGIDKSVRLSKGKPIRKLLIASGLKPRESTVTSYVAERPLESVSIAPGHEIEKEAIRLLTASGGNDWRKKLLLSLKRRIIKIRI